MDNNKLRKHLKQRIIQQNDFKMDDSNHKVDMIYANGKGSGFQEILDYMDEKYYIDKDGVRQDFK